MKKIAFIVILASSIALAGDLQDKRRAALESYYAKIYEPGCEGTTRANDPFDLESIQYCDVDGDGIEDAIIKGSSCGSGTGGPDIHDVLKFNANGTITDITPVEGSRSGDTFNGQPIYDTLIGNVNFDIAFRNGVLLYIFYDASGRPEPLVLKFKWANGRFKLIEVVKNGVAPSSTRTVTPSVNFSR